MNEKDTPTPEAGGSIRDVVHVLQKENARLHQENADLRDELFRLRTAIQALIDLEDTLNEITEDTDVILLVGRILMAAMDAVDSDNGSLILLDEERDELVFVDVRGPYRYELMGYRMPRTEGIVGWAITHRKPVLAAEARQDVRFSPLVDEKLGFRTVSLICVPLYADERPLGAIEVVNSRRGVPFHEEDLYIMRLVGLLAAEALKRAEETFAQAGQKAT